MTKPDRWTSSPGYKHKSPEAHKQWLYLKDAGSDASLSGISTPWPACYTTEFQSTTLILWIWPRLLILVSYLALSVLTTIDTTYFWPPIAARWAQNSRLLWSTHIYPTPLLFIQCSIDQGALGNLEFLKISFKFCLLEAEKDGWARL